MHVKYIEGGEIISWSDWPSTCSIVIARATPDFPVISVMTFQTLFQTRLPLQPRPNRALAHKLHRTSSNRTPDQMNNIWTRDDNYRGARMPHSHIHPYLWVEAAAGPFCPSLLLSRRFVRVSYPHPSYP